MTTARRMVLSALPLPSNELRTLFRSGDGTIRRLLERPPTLRQAGWDLETGDAAQLIRGQRVRVANGDRKVLDLYRDGTFVFSCRADDWFLAWASPHGQQRINPLALVEVVFSFTEFYKHVVDDLDTPPREIQVRADFRNLHEGGQRTSLVPHALGTYAQILNMHAHEAPDNDFSFVRTISATEYDPAVVAYVIVREIYLWFGIDEDGIPYITKDSGVPKVDVDAIRNA